MEKAEPVQVRFTLEGPTEYVNARWCKVYVESYVASNGSCFVVTWTRAVTGKILENHVREIQDNLL